MLRLRVCVTTPEKPFLLILFPEVGLWAFRLDFTKGVYLTTLSQSVDKQEHCAGIDTLP